ncbi:MAG: hypothetical protein PHD33_05700, partial [Atribacterota bacterium]|nr:hypothetical protein [Atribacterota bacterium]
ECGKKIPMKKKCSHCGRVKIKPLGFGTQHAEVLIKRMFPRAIIRRLDIDVAPKRIMQKKIVNEFNKGEIDILIGTQLLFQEINFEKAGLLALLFADHMLNITDYSSAELSYQFIKKLILFLTQKKKEKSLIIQTYQPDHYIFEAIKNRDYNYFYQEETKIRRELDYPPFTKIIKIDFFGEKEEKVKQEAVCFLEFLEKSALLDKSGLDAAINKDNLAVIKEKEKNKIIFTLKVDLTKNDLATLKRSLLKYNIKNQFSEVRMTIDIDPIKMS